jgi:hypothetical protein
VDRSSKNRISLEHLKETYKDIYKKDE